MLNMRQETARAALWLDVEKPGWERFVPLEKNKVHMTNFNCAPCILDFVFADEARAIGWPAAAGWDWAEETYTEVGCKAAFIKDDALPYWRDEIAARLARWAPSEAAVSATVDA